MSRYRSRDCGAGRHAPFCTAPTCCCECHYAPLRDTALLEAANRYVALRPCTNQSPAGDACGACESCLTWAAIRAVPVQ
jgi:hypothetical protein